MGASHSSGYKTSFARYKREKTYLWNVTRYRLLFRSLQGIGLQDILITCCEEEGVEKGSLLYL